MQDSYNSYGEREGLKGPVHSICQVTYLIDSINQNNEIIKGNIATTLTNACYKLDSLLNIIYSYEINPSGGIQYKKKYAYEYDAWNRIVAKYFYTESWQFDDDTNIKSDFKLYEKDSYKYDENGNLCCWTRSEPDGQIFNMTIYEFDLNGKLTKRVQKDSTDKVLNSEMIKYDRLRNRIIKKEYYLNNLYNSKTIERHFIDRKKNKVFDTKTKVRDIYEFYYNSNGRVIKEMLYNKKGKVTGLWLNQYNEKNELISQEFYNVTSGKLLELEINRKYIFKYDAFGNWNTKVFYDKGKPIEITERQIEYK